MSQEIRYVEVRQIAVWLSLLAVGLLALWAVKVSLWPSWEIDYHKAYWQAEGVTYTADSTISIRKQLQDGWEPFAVTPVSNGEMIHFRRRGWW